MKFTRKLNTNTAENTHNTVNTVSSQSQPRRLNLKNQQSNVEKETSNVLNENTASANTKQPKENMEHSAMNTTKVTKILPKFVNRSAKSPVGSAVEFSASAFNLGKMVNGYRDSMDGKFLMNFWTFDTKSTIQQDFIPTYMDMSEWLNVCHMILSGRLHEMTEIAREKQKAGNYRYCGYIYQSNGGSLKPIYKVNGKQFGGQSPIASVFKITPAMKDDSWVLSSEIYPGVQTDTGLIEIKSGSKPFSKISVLFSYDDLVRVARMSEMAIQCHMMKYC